MSFANSHITKSITIVNTQLLGSSPALSMANLLATTSYAISLAALNATQAQQQNNILAQANTIMSIAAIYSVNFPMRSKTRGALLRALFAK